MKYLKRFDQRALAWTGLMMLTILLAGRSWSVLLVSIIAIAVAIQLSLPVPSNTWRRLAGFYWFYLLNFIFILFFTEHSYHFNTWSDWLNSSWGWAAFYTLRLVEIIALMLYLAHWLRAEELLLGIISATSRQREQQRPQKWTLGAPLQRFLWTLLFAYHFLPLLRHDVQRMRLSVLARGMSFKGKMIRRFRVYLSFLVPLLNSVFRRADALVTVLATRHFDPGGTRTMYHVFKMQAGDWVLAGTATAVCCWLIL